jgi:hypothetical protein
MLNIWYHRAEQKNPGGNAMRAFITAVIVAIVLAVVGGFVLNKLQEPASVAFSTEGVRL